MLSRVVPVLGPEDALWLAWPRKAAGHVSDLGDNVVRAAALQTGLVDIKVAAIGEDWSGLRFVWRRERRDDVRRRLSPGERPRTLLTSGLSDVLTRLNEVAHVSTTVTSGRSSGGRTSTGHPDGGHPHGQRPEDVAFPAVAHHEGRLRRGPQLVERQVKTAGSGLPMPTSPEMTTASKQWARPVPSNLGVGCRRARW